MKDQLIIPECWKPALIKHLKLRILMDPVEASGLCLNTANTRPSEHAGDLGDLAAFSLDTE